MQSPYAHIHLIGIGGIHVSAIAKLLLSLGVQVSGSDLVENEEIKELQRRGVVVSIGQSAEHVPANTEAIVFSSAANEANPERIEGARRGLPAFNSHQFLGVVGKDLKQIVIAGTHGKSTTTAMMAVLAKEAGLAPTVVVGTKVPQLCDGNLEVGTSEWLILEGDEFDHHFLAYHPTVLVINNIEADHFDIYPTVEAMREAFRTLLGQIVDGGMLVVNAEDLQTKILLDEARASLQARGVRIVSVGTGDGAEVRLVERQVEPGQQNMTVQSHTLNRALTITLAVPGEINARNALMCYAVAEGLNIPHEASVKGLLAFQGIWRRLEKIGEKDGITVFSDYGHHPTAVRKTIEAIKEFYPGRRLVLAFQPHHRNRTKHLFTEFTTCFEGVDVLVLCEIYDVKGRDQADDEVVSSRDLVRAIQEQPAAQTVTYVGTPTEALTELQACLKSGDVLVVMGAGDLYKIAYALV